MKIVEILKPEAIIPNLQARDYQQALVEMAECMVRVYPESLPDASEVARRLLERESMGSTSVGEGLAIPHCRMPDVSGTLVVLGISREGIPPHEPQEQQPLQLLVALISPSRAIGEHLRVLARICRLFKGTRLLSQLLVLSSVEEIYDSIERFERQL